MSNNISIRNESHVYLKVDDPFAFAHSISCLGELCCHKNDQDRAHCWLNHLISVLLCRREDRIHETRRLSEYHSVRFWLHRQQHSFGGGNGKDCALRLSVRGHA